MLRCERQELALFHRCGHSMPAPENGIAFLNAGRVTGMPAYDPMAQCSDCSKTAASAASPRIIRGDRPRGRVIGQEQLRPIKSEERRLSCSLPAAPVRSLLPALTAIGPFCARKMPDGRLVAEGARSKSGGPT
jgi:hypothetical protein